MVHVMLFPMLHGLYFQHSMFAVPIMVALVFVVVISSTFLKSERFSWFSLTKYFLFTGHCITEFCLRIYIEQGRTETKLFDFLVIFMG